MTICIKLCAVEKTEKLGGDTKAPRLQFVKILQCAGETALTVHDLSTKTVKDKVKYMNHWA